MLHECLRVNEIADLIFSFVFGTRSRESKRDLLSLALTCHDFKEVALDILWHTQPNFVSLIKTLPENRRVLISPRDSNNPPSFKLRIRSGQDHELRRLASYARRIRKINYVDPGIEDLKGMQTIWKIYNKSKRSEPLFSGLTRLEFGHYGHAQQCLEFLMESGAISLSFFWAGPNPIIVQLFPIIQAHALNMRELDFGTLRNREARIDCPALSQLVCQMAELRSISCAERLLNSMAIQHLSSLPHLRGLVIPNTSKSLLEGLGETSDHFSELQELTMYEDDLVEFARLLEQLRPLHLCRITLHLLERLVPSAHDLRAALTALEQCSSAHANVREIRFKHVNPRQPIYQYQAENTDPREKTPVIVNGSAFEPALAFRMLTVFEVDIPYVFALSDAELVAMADAWPHLRRLQLGSFSDQKAPSWITYEGLLQLLKRCPKLEFLVFSFDGTSAIPRADGIPVECANENITYIEVGNSAPRNDIDKVARFFKRVFPNLCSIQGAPGNNLFWQEIVRAMNSL